MGVKITLAALHPFRHNEHSDQGKRTKLPVFPNPISTPGQIYAVQPDTIFQK